MERIAVKSRDIAIVGYEAESATLEVAFRNGGVYRYQNVPQDIYQQFTSVYHTSYLALTQFSGYQEDSPLMILIPQIHLLSYIVRAALYSSP